MRKPVLDLAGQKYHRWTVLEQAGLSKDQKILWRCRCDCGMERLVRGYKLTNGDSKSCGCIKHRPSWRRKDLTGKVFGRLTVLSLAASRRPGFLRWLCQCYCGNQKEVLAQDLRNGHTTSCGCRKLEITSRGANRSHGMSKTPEYTTWCSIMARCKNLSDPRYGGRGIRMFQGWLGERGFERFYEHVGPKPSPNHQLERINNDGHYEPGNVRWATRIENSRNKRNTRMLTWNGRTQAITDWADEVGISSANIRNRIDHCGWTVEKALTVSARRPQTETAVPSPC